MLSSSIDYSYALSASNVSTNIAFSSEFNSTWKTGQDKLMQMTNVEDASFNCTANMSSWVMDSGSCSSPYTSTNNDICDRAEVLNWNNVRYVSTNSTTSSLPESNIRDFGSCGDAFTFNPNDQGVWFLVKGVNDGTLLEVATLLGGEADKGYEDDLMYYTNIMVSVFTGPSCNQLNCLATNLDVLHWESISNMDYYIFVHGWEGHLNNEFGVRVREIEPQSNDLCSNAKMLDLHNNETYYSNNYFSTATSNVINNYYCDVLEDDVGVWYQVIGTGGAIEASTCNNGVATATFDTKISVFSGNSCNDELVCVMSNDDYPGCEDGSTVVWESQLDMTYYIFVHGEADDDDRGEFDLTIRERQLHPNDKCSGARVLQLSNDKVYASNTYSATPESNIEEEYCDVHDDEIGVWFQVTGTGNVIEASTQNDLTEFDTKISVFSGLCNEQLRCLVHNDDNDDGEDDDDESVVTWESELNVQYYILVRGFDTEELGEFGISVREGKMIYDIHASKTKFATISSSM